MPVSKRAIQKTEDTTGNLFGNKITFDSFKSKVKTAGKIPAADAAHTADCCH